MAKLLKVVQALSWHQKGSDFHIVSTHFKNVRMSKHDRGVAILDELSISPRRTVKLNTRNVTLRYADCQGIKTAVDCR